MSRSTQRSEEPHVLSRYTSSLLQRLSGIAYVHPIHAICAIAILVSTTYVKLIKDDISHNNVRSEPVTWASLAGESRSVIAGPETNWSWQAFDTDMEAPKDATRQALLTLAFPVTTSATFEAPPPPDVIPYLSHVPVSTLPSTPQPLTAFVAQESHIALSVPYDRAHNLLTALQEIPGNAPGVEPHQMEAGSRERKMWIMKAARSKVKRGFLHWLDDTRSEFLDLLKNSNTLDITTMALIYIAMHLTFVSLFLSMRRLGSGLWLASSVMLSSTFAFLLGLDVSIRLGVPITLKLLSESLPFLVVMIGFEKNISFTQSVLSHAAQLGDGQRIRSRPDPTTLGDSSDLSNNYIYSAIQTAIKEKGYEISRHYFFEILILAAGAHSGIHGGFEQVCFLAAWILAFDWLLLFTFYTSILCIKLEVMRVRQTIDKRYNGGLASKQGSLFFGTDLGRQKVPYFKLWMVIGFVAVNLVDLLLIPSRIPAYDSVSSVSPWSNGIDGVVKAPSIEPFKVAGSGLDELLLDAISHEQTTIITVLAPVKYRLTYPSVHHTAYKSADTNTFHSEEYGIAGAKFVGGLLTSLEDPVLSKWIVAALALSIALNGFFFKASRLGFNDSTTTSKQSRSSVPSRDQGRVLASIPEETPESVQASASSIGQAKIHQGRADFATLIKEQRLHELDDSDLIEACLGGKVPGHALEKNVKDCTRAVKIRRSIVSRTPETTQVTRMLEDSRLPYENYDWNRVLGACCENVIGYTPVPVGVAGPLTIDGKSYYIPMATTEGVLVASASRGCKAINLGGGVSTILTGDGITRGPCVSFDTASRAGTAKAWLDSEAGQELMKTSFSSTSRFARLQSMKTSIAGKFLFIRFKASSGDAMGMNMISKGVEYALKVMSSDAGFSDMNIITLSGNYCADKKPAAINWIEGRGKGIVAEAVIPSDVVEKVLKSSVDSMVQLNHAKNLVGSAMAGSIGGFNAQAANLACALFIATGQDPAQVVEAANCMTLMEKRSDGALQISVTLPSLEVGTLGGGTILEPQGAMLEMLGVRGSHQTVPGENARQLARIIGSAVLAGETSLCAALAAGHLVKAHMAHNRSGTVSK